MARVQNTGYVRSGTVGTTAAQLTSTSRSLAAGLTIKNHDANDSTDYLYVGFSSAVTAVGDGTATDGFPLKPGQGVTVEVDDPALVYLISNAAGTIWSAVGA